MFSSLEIILNIATVRNCPRNTILVKFVIWPVMVSHGVGHWISIRISHGVSLTDSVRGLVTVSHGVNLTINHGVYHGVLDGSVLTCPELLTEQCNAKLSCLKVPISHHSQIKVKSFHGS